MTVYELLGQALVFASTSFDTSSTAGYPTGTQSINILDASAMAKDTEMILVSQDPRIQHVRRRCEGVGDSDYYFAEWRGPGVQRGVQSAFTTS